jgi:hypothetical protein
VCENLVVLSLNSHHLLAVIVSASLADTMSQLHLVATGALHDARQAELPVSATGIAAGLRTFSLGYCHFLHLLILFTQFCCQHGEGI